MFKGYDTTSAEQRLELLALERYNSDHSPTQLSRITSASAHYEAFSVGRTWSLVHKNTNDELVVFLQGIIVKKDLPPFVEKLGRHSSHARYLRQSVTITGLSTSTFARAIEATAGIHALLGRAVGIDNMAECGIISAVNDVPVLEISNRYFKPRGAGVDTDEVHLSRDLDPHGYLAKAGAAMGLYHSEDNVVQYFEREGTDDESYKYNDVKPSHFSQGDIVEIQASFSLFPLKEGKFKSCMILRGITLLDGSFTQVLMKKFLSSRLPASKQSVVKRKVGYGEEKMSVARAKMARMEIDHLEDDDLSDPASSSYRFTSDEAENVRLKGGELTVGDASETLD